MLINLSNCGVGCYIGSNFVGALAYADDVVLIAPTPSAMRKMLAVCDAFALEYNILFNASKSKYVVVAPRCKRLLYKQMTQCMFYIGGKTVDNVESYVHLGHIINSKFDDSDDILHRRNCFIGQANNVFCFFGKMDYDVKISLFKSYCSSFYGCELWNLSDDTIDDFCIAWRKALRRLLHLPYNTHGYFLPLLTDTLPINVELLRRISRFIWSCVDNKSSLVRNVALYGVQHARQKSCIGRNMLFCCDYFDWHITDFLQGNISLEYKYFIALYLNQLSQSELNSAVSLYEILQIREGDLTIADFTFSEINDIVKLVAC